ncbi:MAG: hypothetical protein GY906_04620 [bacterium]|nr:hypothetical protein [bacterium]
MKKTTLIVGLVALLGAAPVMAQNFSMYVALGDSITAGYSNAGLAQSMQTRSYAALLANAAGVGGSFELPLVSDPGMPGMWSLSSLATGSPQFYVPPMSEWGMPLNATLPRPYNNLSVPGADVEDMIFKTGDINRILTGTATPDTMMFDLILRDNTFTALEQAIGLDPTFVTVWIGNNDALPAALTATAWPGITLTPIEEFRANYTNAIGALATATDADIVLFTIAEGAILPFATTLPPIVIDPATGQPVMIEGQFVPLIGSNGPVSMDSMITLGAAPLMQLGMGIPVELGGSGLPLPDDLNPATQDPGVIIRPDEFALIQEYISAYNGIIHDVASTFGAHVFDVRPLYNSYMDEGVTYGAINLTGDYLTGGIFSYDGLHQHAIGHGDLAVHLIDFLNETFGGEIPQVDMADIMGTASCMVCVEPALLTANAIDIFTEEARQSMLEILARKVRIQRRTPGIRSNPAPQKRPMIEAPKDLKLNSKAVID